MSSSLFYYYRNSTKKELVPPFLPKMLIIAINTRKYLLFLSDRLICSGRYLGKGRGEPISLPWNSVQLSGGRTKAQDSFFLTFLSSHRADFTIQCSVRASRVSQNRGANAVCVFGSKLGEVSGTYTPVPAGGGSGPELSLVFSVSCSSHSYSIPVY